MNDFLDKLSSYVIFNYFVPGVIFAAVATWALPDSYFVDDLALGVVVYYFYGIVVSRIGSLILEPVLKRLKLVQVVQRDTDFLAASTVDTKIEILFEQTNMFRTLASLFLCVLVLMGLARLQTSIPGIADYRITAGVVLLFALFIGAYRKQAKYVREGIAGALRSKAED